MAQDEQQVQVEVEVAVQQAPLTLVTLLPKQTLLPDQSRMMSVKTATSWARFPHFPSAFFVALVWDVRLACPLNLMRLTRKPLAVADNLLVFHRSLS